MAASIKTVVTRSLHVRRHISFDYGMKRLSVRRFCKAIQSPTSSTDAGDEKHVVGDQLADNKELREIRPEALSSASTETETSFARTFGKLEKLRQSDDEDMKESFPSMLRKSKLMQIGHLKQKRIGRTVQGTIFEVQNDDLYIDFGGKFFCVCKRPQQFSHLYSVGAKVKLSLFDTEMTSKFLGSDKHVTLLEADATLIGLLTPPSSQKRIQEKSSDILDRSKSAESSQ